MLLSCILILGAKCLPNSLEIIKNLFEKSLNDEITIPKGRVNDKAATNFSVKEKKHYHEDNLSIIYEYIEL